MRVLIIHLFISFSSLGQEDKLSKFYLGIGGGVAPSQIPPFRGADVNFDNYNNTGISLTILNLGYRINETFGISANWNSSAHNTWLSTSTVGIGYLSVGGIISVPTKQFTWDIKPQYAPIVGGQYLGDILTITNSNEILIGGSGFVFGNSLVRSTKRGITYSLDLDYLSAYFNQTRIDGIIYDDNSSYSSFRIGVGVRYNFGRK
tara:strand:- start:122 stop:733 length:612 start_codon:yes stop_codon:yes gene_type:complete